MRIEFPRHARRRMELYGIQAQDVIELISKARKREGVRFGRRETVDTGMTGKYGYPLKVVFSEEPERVVVVSAYPLKKGRRR